MRHGSLFSGIGGFDLAAEWMGWENVFHCEWNKFGQQVLKYYWPKAISYEDITKTDFTVHRGSIDIITGGFPCQPFSTSGKRLGKADERHLFPEMLRCIKEIKPRWIVGENVRGLVSWNGGMVFNEVYDELEREGYEVTSFLIPASSVGARHQRQRVWFIANSKCTRLEYRNKKNHLSITDEKTFKERSGSAKNTKTISCGFDRSWRINEKTKDIICVGNDGLSIRLDGITFPKWRKETMNAAGNAIVPQVVYQIFKAIEEYESLIN